MWPHGLSMSGLPGSSALIFLSCVDCVTSVLEEDREVLRRRLKMLACGPLRNVLKSCGHRIRTELETVTLFQISSSMGGTQQGLCLLALFLTGSADVALEQCLHPNPTECPAQVRASPAPHCTCIPPATRKSILHIARALTFLLCKMEVTLRV